MTSPSIIPDQDSRAKAAKQAFDETIDRGERAAAALKRAMAEAADATQRFGRAARKVGNLDADS